MISATQLRRLLIAIFGAVALTTGYDSNGDEPVIQEVAPVAAPFESAPEAGTVKIRFGRSLQLRTKADIYRTLIADATVCDVAQFTPRDVSIVGRAIGQTQITFWFDEPSKTSITYLIDVR